MNLIIYLYDYYNSSAFCQNSKWGRICVLTKVNYNSQNIDISEFFLEGLNEMCATKLDLSDGPLLVLSVYWPPRNKTV